MRVILIVEEIHCIGLHLGARKWKEKKSAERKYSSEPQNLLKCFFKQWRGPLCSIQWFLWCSRPEWEMQKCMGLKNKKIQEHEWLTRKIGKIIAISLLFAYCFLIGHHKERQKKFNCFSIGKDWAKYQGIFEFKYHVYLLRDFHQADSRPTAGQTLSPRWLRIFLHPLILISKRDHLALRPMTPKKKDGEDTNKHNYLTKVQKLHVI